MNLILYRGPDGLELCEEPPRDYNFVDLVLDDDFDLATALHCVAHERATEGARHAVLQRIEEVNEAAIAAGNVCRICGCSDFNACYPPCHWVEPNLCSRCDGNPDRAPDPRIILPFAA